MFGGFWQLEGFEGLHLAGAHQELQVVGSDRPQTQAVGGGEGEGRILLDPHDVRAPEIQKKNPISPSRRADPNSGAHKLPQYEHKKKGTNTQKPDPQNH